MQPKDKTGAPHINEIVIFSLVGGVSAAFFYLGQSITSGGMNPEFLVRCIGAGMLGGLIPGAIKEAIRRHIPLLQSWLSLLILVFAVPILPVHLNFYWMAFIYGYLGHLLWEGYRRHLPKI